MMEICIILHEDRHVKEHLIISSSFSPCEHADFSQLHKIGIILQLFLYIFQQNIKTIERNIFLLKIGLWPSELIIILVQYSASLHIKPGNSNSVSSSSSRKSQTSRILLNNSCVQHIAFCRIASSVFFALLLLAV